MYIHVTPVTHKHHKSNDIERLYMAPWHGPHGMDLVTAPQRQHHFPRPWDGAARALALGGEH